MTGPRTVILSGGVGGARFTSGYSGTLAGESLTVIGNVADDEEFHGLWVSPDMDTLTYTLAGLEGPHGWGIAGDRTHALSMLEQLGNPAWMTIGDRDFGVHIHRTLRRALGVRPTAIALEIARRLGVEVPILPATDDRVQTRIETPAGELSFQTFFVKNRAEPEIVRIRYDGIETARATPEVLAAIEEADRIIIAPSNPVVSILPILKIAGIEAALQASSATKLAVSPFIARKAVKGPAVEMMRVIGHEPDGRGLLAIYERFLDGVVVDRVDLDADRQSIGTDFPVFSTDTLMTGIEGRQRLASDVRGFFARLEGGAA